MENNFNYKQVKGIKYIKYRDFNKAIANGMDYSIIGRTRLKDGNEEGRQIIAAGKKYTLGTYKNRRVIGYIPAGNNRYIEYVGIYMPLIYASLLLTLGAIGFTTFKLVSTSKTTIAPDFSEIKEEENVIQSEVVLLDKLVIDLPEGSAKYEITSNDEDNHLKDVSNLTVTYSVDDTEYNLINEDIIEPDSNEYEFTLDFDSLDNELLPGSYIGNEVLTYSNGQQENKNIDIVVRKSNNGSIEFGYEYNVKINKELGTISMYYSADTLASHDSAVQIILVNNGDEYLLGESGKIKPGKSIETMKLNDDMRNKITQGTYSGYMRVFFNAEDEEYAQTALYVDIETTITVN